MFPQCGVVRDGGGDEGCEDGLPMRVPPIELPLMERPLDVERLPIVLPQEP